MVWYGSGFLFSSYFTAALRIVFTSGTSTTTTRVTEQLAHFEIRKQVIEVLTDPASSGQGGRPDEPLLLVQKLAVDETDAVFGAFESRFLRHAADAGSWSPLPGGFNRWVEMYHRKVLRGTRPVLVTVHVSCGFCFRCWRWCYSQ